MLANIVIDTESYLEKKKTVKASVHIFTLTSKKRDSEFGKEDWKQKKNNYSA